MFWANQSELKSSDGLQKPKHHVPLLLRKKLNQNTMKKFTLLSTFALIAMLTNAQDGGSPTTGSCYALEVVQYESKKDNQGNLLPASRQITSRALGAAQNSDETTSEANINFVALGFGAVSYTHLTLPTNREV